LYRYPAEDYVGGGGEDGAGYEMPAVAAVVGGILGQELLRAVTGKGEPVRNAFFFSMANSQGTIENIGCPR
jgi:ubiquitin-like 1-activating enzyme E1 A